MKASVRANIYFHTSFGVSQLITFNNLSDNKEHFALVFKNANLHSCPLVRIHSECITGDVFHSEHCDCGDQINEALKLFSKSGGIILYLRQEGRGIGFYNKIDAYELQAKNGIDTFKANELLNFPADMRSFEPAAEMLLALNVSQIELLTNNPNKKCDIEKFGIKVVNTRNTGVFEKEKNKMYLQAKLDIAGHKIKLRRN